MTTRSAAVPLALAVLLAACSSSGTASPSAAPASAVPATTAPSEAPSAAPSAATSEAPSAAAEVTVAVADNPLGSILVDGDGMTLYLFTPDTEGASTCYDACAEAWPPLLAGSTPAVGEGLDAADLGTTTRTDGDVPQVTFKGWPLYFFAGDAAAGDTSGQGLNDVWWVVGPDGTAIGAPAAGVEVRVASTSLGDVLVDGRGMTLYMFTADKDGASACSDECLANWPPLLAEDAPTVGDGLDAASFGSITRDDGSTQLTFFDMPLYFFAGDAAPGDVAGQGLGDAWYVLAPDGTVVR